MASSSVSPLASQPVSYTHLDVYKRQVESGLKLLKKGGLMTLCIYSGGDTGYQERDEMLAFIRQLDPHKYLVILSEYANLSLIHI